MRPVCLEELAKGRGLQQAELVSAGAVSALCRTASMPGGGRLASAAAAALADAAQDGTAVVQVRQGSARLRCFLA